MILLLICVEELGQAKVGDLDVLGGLHQNIPGSQVPVDQVTLLQVAHPLGGQREVKGQTVDALILLFSYTFKRSKSKSSSFYLSIQQIGLTLAICTHQLSRYWEPVLSLFSLT